MAGDPHQMNVDLIMNDTQPATTAADRKARRAAKAAERAFRESKGYEPQGFFARLKKRFAK